MTNTEIAKIFREIADFLELKGENPYKIRAYRTVVRSIEELPVSVEDLDAQGRLREIPGAGEAIRKKISELVTTGQLKYYENLKVEFPDGIGDLLAIPGVGPKTAQRLYHELGISSIDGLEQAIVSGKASSLPRMGVKMRENILRGIQELRNPQRSQD
ncbi:MAG: helix-hairpin-helix domain-containing protein [Chloroflexota bacterium]